MFNFLLEGSGSSGIITIVLMVVLFGGLYFFMIRPQKKQEKKDSAMRDALAIGDEVTTIGGIIGKVVSIKGETFVLETTKDKTKIRFLRGAIRSVDVKAEDIVNAVNAEQAKDTLEALPAVEDEPKNEQKPSKRAMKKARKAELSEAPAEDNSAENLEDNN